MAYQFQFGSVFAGFDQLLWGAWLTVLLSAAGIVLGLAIGVAGGWGRANGPRWMRWAIAGYVEAIRNTPFLVQLFLIFFGLPSLGIRMSAGTAALLTLTINTGAYCTEIVRAGIEAVPRGQIEAGRALGLSRFLVFRFLILFPALKTVYPALASQFTLMMLATSVVSQISAEELTFAANFMQSRTFRSFEIYGVVTLMYLALALLFRGFFRGVHWALFERGR
ncbi:amino acid ABC transporter membrane protein 1 (PAAT family) [Stella humosa]|uniref:Amino acid ABC transporter membrane protein 1 (PAAT family) n=1 Tax=Stella humosa TaxID=94 RepID=A0A3N1LHF8_9PROT|nr:amino acid ABC transporter permease [Stella humosa]ROP90792.1 amino acid ABC transporter membrane protein 1 (PAAT family) [Stella humosa]BBK34862.1 ABC transporter permease [Stella humosa]